ncbi:hypothetical protein MTR67_036215 [Solanum verrucosum]|uniref:Reverse transcriptase zinc-binding domain-containing protein n=1 Tax=Solanum verrucosum TaxID=315347 RepID=A0AAF0ZMD2_SOLVR|nr:hypothetical protein MTR67_036215 [Solanum verrucosum]
MFLWGSSEGHRKISLVAWDNVCKPKKYGGLNVKRRKLWNLASVGKLLWQIVNKKDVLWAKWVNEIYMKADEDIWSHEPSQDSSWYWRRLNALKDMMSTWYDRGVYRLTSNGQYSVSSSYNALLGNMNIMREADLIWNCIMLPRQRMISWLAYQNKLLTKERLQRMHIQVENTVCCLCDDGVDETDQHLFAECKWINEARTVLATWMGIDIPQKARNWKVYRQTIVNNGGIVTQIQRELKERVLLALFLEGSRKTRCS